MGTYQEIDVGTTANDGTGDPLRTAMIKVNENFANGFTDPVITDTITVGNSSVNAVIANTPSMTFANSTVSGVINSVAVQFVDTSTSTTSNLNSIQLRIGDPTANITTAINASATIIGNTTANVVITNSSITVANSTQGNVRVYPNRVDIGANVSINAVAAWFRNTSTSANLTLDYSVVSVANGTHGIANVEAGKITVGANVTVNTTIVTAPAANVTSNTGFTLGSSSAAANGYTYLPNGLKMVWGWVLANTTVGDATFADAFSTSVYSVTSTGNTADYVYVTSKTTTGASIRTSNTTGTNVQFIVIGK